MKRPTQEILYLDSLPLTAYQKLPFAVFIKNLKGQYLWANDFFINKSAGFNSMGDIYNKQDYYFSWHQYADDLRKNDALLFESGENLSVYEQILRHDGTVVNIVSKKTLLYNDKTHITGLLGISLSLPHPKAQNLTSREREVLCLLSRGYTDKQTAKKLEISPRTVEAHINHSKQKLGAKTRSELIFKFSR